MQPGTSVEQELSRRILWFIHLRWLAAAGTLATLLFGNLVLKLGAPFVPLLGLVAFLALYNLVCQLVATGTRLHDSPGSVRRSSLFANLQIALDLIALTLLLHYSGGAENPFAFYFIFHIIIASILLSPRATYLQSLLAIVLFNGMAVAEGTGLIPHIHLRNFLPAELNGTVYVLALQAVFTTTVAISVYMATSITRRLREHERAVLSLSVQLAGQNDKLREAFDMLSYTQSLQTQYMRKVSHELRSPLAAIESMLTLVAQKVVTEEMKRQELVERSLNRIRGLLRMVNDLLILLRSRNVTLPEQFQPVDLQTVADKVLDLLTSRAQSQRVTLEADLQPGLSPVFGDAEGVEQLLTNLLSNGIKYTPEGGRVQLRVSQEEEKLKVEVSDTGIGIDPEDLSRVFNEFYRSNGARHFNPVGTGLGLSIVKSIVESHQGSIDVESVNGKGTTFRVLLPAAPQPTLHTPQTRSAIQTKTNESDSPLNKS
ncbi:MAG: hypothetical protein HY318_14115 [Armatimonadetes bacterium]|nr:hypothetical protein [Armatimonadota bacterium]